MNTRKMMKSLIASVASVAAIPLTVNAASSIAIDSVTQRWPWNNKVDITYTVTDGQNREAGVYAGVDFTISIPGRNPYAVRGYSLGASAETGGTGSKQYTVTWTAPAGVKATDCTVAATLFPTNVPSGNDYMIVDLTTGQVFYEGLMATQSLSNNRYNTGTYKNGGLMALRKIPKWADKAELPNAAILTGDGYPTGDDDFTKAEGNGSVNNSATWATGDEYYIGVFPVTYYQHRKVIGQTDAGDTPVRLVSYSLIRGSRKASTQISGIVRDSDFMGKLNELTENACGVRGFDLPTEPMFEIACRAGATTTYFWGDALDTDYIVCSANSGNENTDPGLRKPNDWGLYGMIGGSVYQWCRDLFNNSTDLKTLYTKNGVTDAFVPVDNADAYSGGNWYAARGGGTYEQNASDITASGGTGRQFYASMRTSRQGWTDNRSDYGFRVAYVARWGK